MMLFYNTNIISYNNHHSKNSALPPPTTFFPTRLVVALGLGVALGLVVALGLGQSFAEDALHFDSFNESFKMEAISNLILLSSFIISV